VTPPRRRYRIIAVAVLTREPQNRKLAFLRALLPEALRRLDSSHLTRDDPVAATRVLLAVGSMLTAPATAEARRIPATVACTGRRGMRSRASWR
jgi:hypothetical protein